VYIFKGFSTKIFRETDLLKASGIERREYRFRGHQLTESLQYRTDRIQNYLEETDLPKASGIERTEYRII
jgi:hypothetical protein